MPRPPTVDGTITPGKNVDHVDVEAGMALAATFGYEDAQSQTVIEYALMRHRKGEEDGAERSALSGGIDLTSWKAALAAAIASGEEKATASSEAKTTKKKYVVYTKETVYRTFEVETDDDMIAEHDREKLRADELIVDYEATEFGDHGSSDLQIVMVEPIEHFAARQNSNWWTDAWEGEPPAPRAIQEAGL